MTQHIPTYWTTIGQGTFFIHSRRSALSSPPPDASSINHSHHHHFRPPPPETPTTTGALFSLSLSNGATTIPRRLLSPSSLPPHTHRTPLPILLQIPAKSSAETWNLTRVSLSRSISSPKHLSAMDSDQYTAVVAVFSNRTQFLLPNPLSPTAATEASIKTGELSPPILLAIQFLAHNQQTQTPSSPSTSPDEPSPSPEPTRLPTPSLCPAPPSPLSLTSSKALNHHISQLTTSSPEIAASVVHYRTQLENYQPKLTPSQF